MTWKPTVIAFAALFTILQYSAVHELFRDFGNSEELYPPLKSAKDLAWDELKVNQQQVLNQHQYCMLWCPSDEYNQTSEWEFYRDLSASEAQKRGSYYSTEFRDFYQRRTQEALNVTCCQVATRESFTVLTDTRSHSNLDKDVTLVTFGTFERVEALLEIRERWHGPLVVMIYMQDHNDLLYEISHDDDHLTSQQELTELKELVQWKNTAVVIYHARFEHDKEFLKVGFNANYFNFSTYSYFATNESKVYSREEARELNLSLLVDFPVNSLRNIAQDFATTRYVFAVDIDFMPDNSIYEFFKTQISKISHTDKAGIVVPHFDRRPDCEWKSRVYADPVDFKSLDGMLKAALIRPFCAELWLWQTSFPESFHWTEQDLNDSTDGCKIVKTWRGVFPQGINLTDYPLWFNFSRDSSSPQLFEISQTVLQSPTHLQEYEPYVMLDRVANSTHFLMRYNEVFVNRHRNKSSWIFGLRLTGYRFLVAKEHFLMHKSHPFSPWLEHHKGGLADNQGLTSFNRERMHLAATVYVQTLANQ
jgi:hypothetical protein